MLKRLGMITMIGKLTRCNYYFPDLPIQSFEQTREMRKENIEQLEKYNSKS